MEPDRTEDDNTPSPVDRLIIATRELGAKPLFPDVQREFDIAKADVEAMMIGQAALLPEDARFEIVTQLARSLNLRVKPLVDLRRYTLTGLMEAAPEGVDPLPWAKDQIARCNNEELLDLISRGLNAHG